MHITVIAKAPVAGLVKTRLCPPCTPEQAAAVAAAGLADTVDAIDASVADAQSCARRVLLLDGVVQAWMPTAWAVVAQRGDQLGERLCNGFFDLGPGVITGMETPHVAHLLAGALEAISAGHDVIGPAEDGGYWMIGLCARTLRNLPAVFDGVPMSTSTTYAVQRERLHRAGRSILTLPLARDLDDFADLCAVAASGRTGRLAAMARDLVDGLGSSLSAV